ncbi:MAG TPA: hypothetical protein VGK26_08245 [Thermoanaerobaculia bacterium]
MLLQALETELGGVEVYNTAIRCARNQDLKKEWSEYLDQTEHHVEVVHGIFEALGLDTEQTSPGREIVRAKGKSLVSAMEKALAEAPESAQILAAECVVDAETKDHMNWQLIGAVSQIATGEAKKALKEAYDEVEDEEDEHLYHSKGWCRELWLDSLGFEAKLPPPEEEKDVKTARGEAQTEERRKAALKKSARKVSRGAPGRSRVTQRSV